MNGHCSTCDIESECGYPYKPCDCCNQRKFRPKEQEQHSAKVIQLPIKSHRKPAEQGGK